MKIALIGYGKMGRMIEEIALSRGHDVVCRIDVDNQEDFYSEAFRTADVAIEFTTPHSAYDNVQRAFEAGVKVVSGSTDWFAKHVDELRRQCTDEGRTLFWSSNFSVGVAIFSAVNRYLARIMNGFEQYKPSERETHHVHKLDHPSGTAITLAEQLIKEVDRINAYHPLPVVNSASQQPDITAASDIAADNLPIASIREGENPGDHVITWRSEEDSIIIEHQAHSRRGFALGAVLAAEYTATHEGLLTINDLFPF